MQPPPPPPPPPPTVTVSGLESCRACANLIRRIVYFQTGGGNLDKLNMYHANLPRVKKEKRLAVSALFSHLHAISRIENCS